MHVAYITVQFPAPAETFAANDVRTLQDMGHRVEVHSLRYSHERTAEMLHERDLEAVPVSLHQVSSYRSGLNYALKHPLRFLFLLSWIFQVSFPRLEYLLKSLVFVPRVLEILAHLENDPPDVVHIYWGHYPSLVGHLVQRYLPGVITSISLVAYDIDMAWRGTRKVAQRADVVRTLTRANLPLIERYFKVPPEQVAIIYDCIDTARADRLLADLSQKKTPKRILTAGRLYPGKGMEAVLEVFAQAHRHHPDAMLIILGEGPERDHLEAKVKVLGLESAVSFLGHVSHDEVFREMARAEIFLFLSESERLPNVVKEAMYCECLCITTNTMGMEEMIPSGDYGHLVAVGDTSRASEKLLKVLEDRSAQPELGGRAKIYIREHFAVDRAMETYVYLWGKAIKRRQPTVIQGSLNNV